MSQPQALNPPADQPPSYLAAWITALLLLVVFVLGLLVYPPVFEAAEGAPKPADSVLFIGRFHPIVVHLPVGALMLLALFEIACMSRRGEEKFGAAALLILLVGAAGAVAGVLVGIMLAREGGYEGGNFTLHQAIGIGGTTGLLIALTLRISAMGSGRGGLMDCYRIMFFLSIAFIGLGAHFGGNMTHGNKFLTEYAPPPLAGPMAGFEKWMLGLVDKSKEDVADDPVVPAPEPPKAPEPEKPAVPAPKIASTPDAAPVTPVQGVKEPPSPPPPPPATTNGGNGDAAGIATDDSALVFNHVILPILEAKCNKCHNEEKSKGELRMDTHELLLKGGEGEPGRTVIPGKPDESLAITRIKLPIDDDDHMPPEGKYQMTEDETALLHWWIQQGASATQKANDAKFPTQMKPLVESLLKKER